MAEEGKLALGRFTAGPKAYETLLKRKAEDDAEYDGEAGVEYDYEEEEEYDYEPQFKEQRPNVRAMLLSFPEAENLKPDEVDEAVERVVEQSKPKYANEAVQGKIRLLREDIELAVDQWEDSFR